MPVDYFLFKIMKELKEHRRKTMVSKELLSRVIDKFFFESYLSEEAKISLLLDYDFEYDVNIMLDNYSYCLSEEVGTFILHSCIKIEDIENILEELSGNYDEELMSAVDGFYDFNIPVLEMIGIRMEKELYKRVLELERNIENNYELLAFSQKHGNRNIDVIMSDLKRSIFKRKFLFNCLKYNLSLEEYNDLYKYSLYNADLLGVETIDFKTNNEEMNIIMETDPFHRALFFSDSLKELVFSESFYTGNDYENDMEPFYTRVIDILDKRTSKNNGIDERLLFAKYRLMYVVDMLFQSDKNYNGYLFMNTRKNNINYDVDYSFIEREIFYLIDEVFEYSDFDMNDRIIGFENTIKSVLIETYYDLTGDNRVIEAIKTHPNYGKVKSIDRLFDDIVNKNMRKIKRKEDE